MPLDLANNARIKYFNFAAGAPSVNFYANGTKVSGILSATGAENAAGTGYGAVFPTSNYSVIAGGTYKINGIVPSTATANPNVSISELSQALTNGKYYSFYTSGIYNSTTKTATNIISRNGTTNGVVAFLGGRTLTVGARGDMTVTSATATNRPLLDATSNQ